ncbi:hypothetical protein C0Q44_16435 [Paenibacillus sp. PCH8]|uniref:hypothetical protein n=1 Tax=Paenibacillus sp. PCH8 TaxID=2066524 RepID=UPI000CF99E2A|nr:hypothetical protein [Paenibacillus sp. PCH8]PQP82950.1 hypothetical protein C0Q44_16435 [Paenibacillus sp. PCH8]
MNEPKTPNLGLNKIDRSSPSTTNFDLEKYLDQNWEKVDEGIGHIEEKAEETATKVSSIQERLDTEKRRSVTLEPGLQVINAERASAFKLEGLKGRTLVNLLGRDGNFVDATKWNIGFGTRTTTNNIITVTGDGSGVNPQLTNYKHISSLTPKVGDKLFLRVLATHIVGTAKQLQLYLYSTTLNRFTAKNIENPVNGTNYELYGMITVTQAIVDGWDTTFGFKLTAEYATYEASNGSQVHFSKAAMYKVADEDKSLTSDQLNVKYPYVDSVQPVRNPYALRYGANLLPPFYKAVTAGNGQSINSSYSATLNASGNNMGWTYNIPCAANTDYTFALSHNGMIALQDMDINGTIIQNSGYQDTVELHIKTSPNAAYLSVIIGNGSKGIGAYAFSNPILNIGTTAKPFKPREDAMLALQTDLHADPLTGANAEEVFGKDGQYFKMAKWRMLDVTNENLPISGRNRYTGYVVASGYVNNRSETTNERCFMTKYDGKQLTLDKTDDAKNAPDQFNVGNKDRYPGAIWISISNNDGGWGDAYTPTVNEIKAYFMGWTMRNMSASNYNDPTNASQKTWTPIGYSPPANWNSTWAHLRTSVPVNESSPSIKDGTISSYQLVYQLAIPTVEPITSEGQLTLIEGDNQVEVGTGIVLREGTKPALSTQWGTYEINSNASSVVASNPLKYKAKKVMTIYKNGCSEKWERSTDANSYGLERAYRAVSLFDPSADYKVTYLMLDTFPIAAFVGSVPDNEKALLTNLVHDVQQGATSLSVVERSLSEALKALQNKRNVWGSIE